MSGIDFKVLKSFRDRARMLLSNHSDYKFHIRDDYIFVKDNQEKIYCAHSKYFDVILSESWRIILKEKESIKKFDDLLQAVWDSKVLEKNKQSFKTTLGIDFEEFIELAKKQFFYFDSKNEQFLFPLFRIIKDDNVIGGFFHFLIKHFEKYSNLHPTSNNQTDYLPNDLLGILIQTCIHSDSVKNEEANQKEDHISIRKKMSRYFSKETKSYESKNFEVVLYFDNNSKLLIVTTFHRC